MASRPSNDPTWRDRAATALLVAAVVLILWFAYRVLHGQALGVVQGEPAGGILAIQRRVILVAAVVVLATSLTLAGLLWRLGRATLEQERFPPAGLPQLIEAEPRKGVAAIYLGRRLCGAALVAGIAGVALALWAAWFALRL